MGFANNIQIRYTIIQYQKATYKQILFAEIPKPIEEAFSREFSGYKANRAFKGDDGTFKITVSFGNRRGTFVFNKKGEILKVEASGYERENLNT